MNKTVSGLGSNHDAGPITLDQETICKRAQELISEAEQSDIKIEADAEAESHEDKEKEEQGRGKRLHKRPSWLKEFVMLARS